MPRGTPITLKCPCCKRGKYGYSRWVHGCFKTGLVERRATWSQHSGFGSGGSSFHGHRGLAWCHDCGYRWFSTLPDSGRVSWLDIEYDGAKPVFASEADLAPRPWSPPPGRARKV